MTRLNTPFYVSHARIRRKYAMGEAAKMGSAGAPFSVYSGGPESLGADLSQAAQ
jgi:hypothetical protein